MLALECLRYAVLDSPASPFEVMRNVDSLQGAMSLVCWALGFELDVRDGDERVVRARLALYLRALLRADAGDNGLTFLRLETGEERPVVDGRCDLGRGFEGKWTFVFRITPLWQLAGPADLARR